tara:strand:+ start:1007 stop:1765 length:759 start_codon:yes stop_codon:yes gene_type:complete
MINRYASLRQGLVGCWVPSLGASGFRLIDLSGYGNHGVLTNMDPGTDWVPSGGKLSLDFDGTDDYVDCGAFQSPFVSAFSISAWLSSRTLPSNNNQQIVFGWGSNNIANAGIFLKVANNSNVLQYFVQKNQNGILTATTTPVVDKWIHFVVTIAGSRNNLYINSANESSGTAGTNPGTGSNFFIGSRAGSLPTNGQIDDVRFYSRVLTPSEISLLYTGGSGVGLIPERIKHRRKTSAAATNRRRRILIGASS